VTTELITVDSDSRSAERLDRHTVAVLPTPPRIDLRTIDDVRVEMARVYRDMRGGKIDTQDGTRLAYVLSQIGKLIESGEIEKRLEAVEGVLLSRRTKR